MSYKSENYLCDISCVQLWKALARFWCGNSQLEVVLGVWKGMPYVERLCRGCNLGKVEDEEHLLLVCPNTQKVRECFCSTIPFTHINTFANYEHGPLAQVCGMLPIPEDNMSSMIYLSFNGLSGPKRVLNCKQ
jgi:hypothetical protein